MSRTELRAAVAFIRSTMPGIGLEPGTRVLVNGEVGTIMYETGSWSGVCLDGEDRIDEYQTYDLAVVS